MDEKAAADELHLHRCPNCDSVIAEGAERCPMCGQTIDWNAVLGIADEARVEQSVDTSFAIEQSEEAREILSPDLDESTIQSEMREKNSPIALLLALLFAILVVSLGVLVLMFPADAAVEFIPTTTPIPTVRELVESPAAAPSETEEPTISPSPIPTQIPTVTTQPPRSHVVSSGETLFGLSLRYGVTMDSIADLNGLPVESALQVSQELLVPWPTATPPLAAVEVEIDGEQIIADPKDCIIYEIKGGDTLYGIAASFNVPSAAMLAVNRLTEVSVLQPGDTICIPAIIFGSQIPATAGPSPTPGPTQPPSGPRLLYPANDAVIDSRGSTLSLQWVAVKNLESDEWYMIELTDLSNIDSHPKRSFTRQNSFQVPEAWAPIGEDIHEFRWRVSIVRVTDQRDDGSFVYTFGGESSVDSYFNWQYGTP